MTKAYSVLQVKSINDDERTITGIASTPNADRDNDVMDMEGAKFALPIPLLWQHNHNDPIGEVTSAEVTKEGILITASIAKVDEDGDLKRRLDTAWQTLKSGLVKCLSIGFRPTDFEYLKDSYGLHIKEWEWYELSAVTVPANPDAVITSVKQIKKAFDGEEVTPEPTKSEKEPNLATPVADKPSHVALVDPNAGSIPLITGAAL